MPPTNVCFCFFVLACLLVSAVTSISAFPKLPPSASWYFLLCHPLCLAQLYDPSMPCFNSIPTWKPPFWVLSRHFPRFLLLCMHFVSLATRWQCIINLFLPFAVSSRSLGQGAECQGGLCQTWCAGETEQCHSKADRILPPTPLQKTTEKGERFLKCCYSARLTEYSVVTWCFSSKKMLLPLCTWGKGSREPKICSGLSNHTIEKKTQ